MENEKLEKVLKALNPLSCADVRRQFERLSRESIGGSLTEADEDLQEHLLLCEDCWLAFAERVARKVESGEIPLAEWPKDLPVPPMDLFTVSAAAIEHPLLGVMWRKLRDLEAQGEKWPNQKLTQLRDNVERFMQFCEGLTGIREPAFATLGTTAVPTTGVQVITAEVLDNNWKPTGTTVRFEIGDKESPRITADGHFTLTARTADRQWVGAQVFCTMILVENQKVSFASVVEPDRSGQSGLVKIEAEGLPRRATVIPISFIRMSLLSQGK